MKCERYTQLGAEKNAAKITLIINVSVVGSLRVFSSDGVSRKFVETLQMYTGIWRKKSTTQTLNAHITYIILTVSAKIGIACTDVICLRTFNTIKEQYKRLQHK